MSERGFPSEKVEEMAKRKARKRMKDNPGLHAGDGPPMTKEEKQRHMEDHGVDENFRPKRDYDDSGFVPRSSSKPVAQKKEPSPEAAPTVETPKEKKKKESGFWSGVGKSFSGEKLGEALAYFTPDLIGGILGYAAGGGRGALDALQHANKLRLGVDEQRRKDRELNQKQNQALNKAPQQSEWGYKDPVTGQIYPAVFQNGRYYGRDADGKMIEVTDLINLKQTRMEQRQDYDRSKRSAITEGERKQYVAIKEVEGYIGGLKESLQDKGLQNLLGRTAGFAKLATWAGLNKLWFDNPKEARAKTARLLEKEGYSKNDINKYIAYAGQVPAIQQTWTQMMQPGRISDFDVAFNAATTPQVGDNHVTAQVKLDAMAKMIAYKDRALQAGRAYKKKSIYGHLNKQEADELINDLKKKGINVPKQGSKTYGMSKNRLQLMVRRNQLLKKKNKGNE